MGPYNTAQQEIMLCMHPVNETRHYNVTSSLIAWVHAQNDLWQQAILDNVCDTDNLVIHIP